MTSALNVVAIVLTLPLAVGQSRPAPAASDSGLGPAHVDGHYGYSIRPPRGWHLTGGGAPGDESGVLLRMLDATPGAPYHEIVLRHRTTAKARSAEELLDDAHAELVVEYDNVRVDARQQQPIGGKPGGLLSATFDSGGWRKLRLHATVPVRPGRHFVLYYQGPERLRVQNERLFHSVLASFRLLEQRFSEARIRQALADGAAWLETIDADQMRKTIDKESYYRLEIDKKAAGFIRIARGETTEKNRQGLGITERGWTFAEDGSVRRLQTNMFISYDLGMERWKHSLTILFPAVGATSPRLDVAIEEGLRETDVLVSSQLYQFNVPATVNQPVHLPPAYLSRALVRLVPQLLTDLDRPRLLAFAVFDHRRADLVFRFVEIKGRSRLPTGGGPATVYRIDESEGLSGVPASLYVDENGRLLLMESGSLRMSPATRRSLERRYDARMTAAERAMADVERAYRTDQRRFQGGGADSNEPDRPPKP